ncbi:pentapeptide repeat-containing protein [Lentilactobacillus kisonensis]|nr:pentapeptide repeat-containing protein [Lentilactobacillus kisonensis]
MAIINKKLAFEDIEPGNQYTDCTFTTSMQAVRVSDVTFHQCQFEQDNFGGSEWLDCRFVNVSFANKRFEGSTFYRDQFESCQLIGTEFQENNWKDCVISGSQVDYANFSSSKINRCRFDDASFKEVYFRYLKLVGGLKTSGCNFEGASFVGTKLKGVDLSQSEFGYLEVNPDDLKGLIINQFQAASLIGLLGVKIK